MENLKEGYDDAFEETLHLKLLITMKKYFSINHKKFLIEAYFTVIQERLKD